MWVVAKRETVVEGINVLKTVVEGINVINSPASKLFQAHVLTCTGGII